MTRPGSRMPALEDDVVVENVDSNVF